MIFFFWPVTNYKAMRTKPSTEVNLNFEILLSYFWQHWRFAKRSLLHKVVGLWLRYSRFKTSISRILQIKMICLYHLKRKYLYKDINVQRKKIKLKKSSDRQNCMWKTCSELLDRVNKDKYRQSYRSHPIHYRQYRITTSTSFLTVEEKWSIKRWRSGE